MAEGKRPLGRRRREETRRHNSTSALLDHCSSIKDMKLEDALGAFPGQPNNPLWAGSGQPSANSIWPGAQSGGGPWPSPSPGPAAAQSLTVPYNQSLPAGVYDKLLITIAGTIKANADKFTVDLTAARDLVFHFNPRFNEGGNKVIVRNSCINERWGQEERALPRFPFVQGQPFELKILCTSTDFKVAVNNSHLLSFTHRYANLRAIDALNIYNDVTLSRVHMETLP